MNKRPLYSLIGIGVLGAAVLGLRMSPAQEELDSVKVCPDTQKVVFENAFVRAIDDQIPPGVAEKKHQHRHGLTVILTNYDTEQKTYPDGKITRSHRKFGDVNWSEPVVHEVRNVGTTPSHAVRIELK